MPRDGNHAIAFGQSFIAANYGKCADNATKGIKQAQLERIKRLREQQMLAKYQEDMKMNESMLSLAKTGPDAARLLARREAIENRAAAERSKRKDS